MPGYPPPVTGHPSTARRDEEEAGRRDTTYVALVHGAATDDPDVWARTLLTRVIRRWSERDDYAVEIIGCAEGCVLHPKRHRHLRITRDGRTENVDLEAVYWGSLVHAGGWWASVRQSFHIGGAVLLADYAAVWSALFGRHAYRAPINRPGPLLALGRVLTLLVRMVAAPLIVAALFALTGFASFRRAVADAYEWMTDDKVRADIVQVVADAVRRARADRVVLAGHSQGGSIVLRARDALIGTDMTDADRVTTFGNADPLLRTVRLLGIQSGLGRYWLLLTALWVLSVIVAAAPAFALLCVLVLAGTLAGAIIDAGGMLWQLPTGSVLPGAWEFSAEALRLSVSGLALSLVPAAIAALLISVALNRTGLTRRILAGPDDSGPDDAGADQPDADGTGADGTHAVPGHDVIARDDPLAPLVRALCDPRRIRQIPQTASILLDHEAYYRNSATSLPTLFEDVWQRSMSDDAGHPADWDATELDDAKPDDAEQRDAGQSGAGTASGADVRTLTRWYRTGLRRRRIAVFLVWAGACGAAVALGAATGSHSLAWVALLAVSGGAVWARLALLWRWMEWMDTAARTGPHVIARIARRLRARNSAVFTVFLFVGAAVALGGSGVFGAVDPQQPDVLSFALLALGAGLVAAACGAMAGARFADVTGVTCLLALSALWLAHGPLGWIAVGVAVIGCAFRAFALIRRA